jgi:hypothetical protein
MDHIVFYTPLSFFLLLLLLLLLNILTLYAHQRYNNTTFDCINIDPSAAKRERERESAAVAHMLPRTVRVPSLDKKREKYV